MRIRSGVELERNILLTGFEPFAGDEMNPSGEAAKALDGKKVSGYNICGVVLPVEWGTTARAIEEAIDKVDPALVLSLGLSSGRPELNVEKVAVNYMSRAKDNREVIPETSIICGDGPDAYFATLPVEDIVEELRKKGIPARLSLSAGGYLCNYTFYTASNHVAKKGQGKEVPVGFIHVPATPGMVAESGKSMASMSLEMIQEGVLTTISISIRILARQNAKRRIFVESGE